MDTNRPSGKIAILGDYPPRQCGIATFTRDLREAVAALRPDWDCPVITVTEPEASHEYPAEVRFEIPEDDRGAYLRAADFLNLSHADVLCVQHEFGIFGGPAGSHVTELLGRARMPTVTTLHTVLANPDPAQRLAFGGIVENSSKLVVMTERGAEMLRDIHGVAPEKIAVIPHGIPDTPFMDPNFHKDRFGIAGRPALLTFGLLSPGKGIEYAIRAMPEIAERHPDAIYIVLGATHPNLLRRDGERHRRELQELALELGVDSNVRFINRYVGDAELREFIGAADIYLTPYLNEAQITSGTLSYCFGAGKAVVSTPYWHAEELLADGRGHLVPFRDAPAIAAAVNLLLDEDSRRHALRKQAYLAGREMVWPRVAEAYDAVFEEARAEFKKNGVSCPRPAAPAPGAELEKLPIVRLGHLDRLSDSTGVFQHAIFTVPWLEHGYCTDDNARALILTVLLEEQDEPPAANAAIQSAAAAFLQNAFVHSTGRFRNFLSFQRAWLEDEGSEDSHGRAVWALGSVVGHSRQEGLRGWAAELFGRSLAAVASFTSPRAWAFALLGLNDYFRSLHGDLFAARIRRELSAKLFALFEKNAAPGWPWPEDIVAYDNPRLCQALILAGRWIGEDAMRDAGIASLHWLMENQTGIGGCFRPVGSGGFWRRGHASAMFDQQPLEAAAAVEACIEAFHATGDAFWKSEAARAFAWFTGSNDLGLPIADPETGGCHDGLHDNRVNRNQGAESTLAWLTTLARMRAFAADGGM